MGLYPHKSRRRRVETAATAALLYLVVTALLGALLYDMRGQWTWNSVLDRFGFLLIWGIVGLAGLIAYVRGGRR
jgi:hypothetical protein